MRLFVAIGLPTPVAEALAQSARSLIRPSPDAKIRWTPPANMHITLSFLGQVHEARLDIILQALATIRARRLQLRLNGFSTFDRAGVLYADVKPAPALVSLASQVVAAMEAIGFPREDRPYAPHITLARTRERLRTSLDRGRNDPAFHQSFDATEFRLYQSFTLPEGPRYDVLRTFPLD